MVQCPHCKGILTSLGAPVVNPPSVGSTEPAQAHSGLCNWCGEVDCGTLMPKGAYVRLQPTRSKVREGPYSDKQCPTCHRVLSAVHYSLRLRKETGYFELRYQCRDCDKPKHHARSYKWVRTKQDEFASLYEFWISISKNLPTSTLTEEEWAEICRYFKGCALCGDPHIETREFFQKSTVGGKYTKYNTIPTCGKCSTIFRNIENPFMFYTPLKSFGIKLPSDKLDTLIKYFLRKIVGDL